MPSPISHGTSREFTKLQEAMGISLLLEKLAIWRNVDNEIMEWSINKLVSLRLIHWGNQGAYVSVYKAEICAVSDQWIWHVRKRRFTHHSFVFVRIGHRFQILCVRVAALCSAYSFFLFHHCLDRSGFVGVLVWKCSCASSILLNALPFLMLDSMLGQVWQESH